MIQMLRRGLVLDLSVAFGEPSLSAHSARCSYQIWHHGGLSDSIYSVLTHIVSGLGTTFGYLFWYGMYQSMDSQHDGRTGMA